MKLNMAVEMGTSNMKLKKGNGQDDMEKATLFSWLFAPYHFPFQQTKRTKDLVSSKHVSWTIKVYSSLSGFASVPCQLVCVLGVVVFLFS